MVDFFCAHYKQRALTAACRPDSNMLSMLLKGFLQTSVSNQGHLLLRRES
jgi:hypothetical protein